jgi:hypothetical protein
MRLASVVTYVAVPAVLLLAACTTERRDGSPQIQTTNQAERESLEGAAGAPLRDVNVLQTKIPEVLLTAMTDPYALPKPMTCARLTALILPLNGALGADLDEQAQDEDDLVGRGHGAALGLAASAASSVIPFRGWIRKLSGAEKHDQLVSDAITAGAVRRAYLKGLGEAHGCYPPATPSHLKVEPTPVQDDGGRRKPKYPVR